MVKLPESGKDYLGRFLGDVYQEIVQMEEWYYENFLKKRQDDRRRSNFIIRPIQDRRHERQPTVEINLRFTSFLEYDNSFLSPWNFNPRLNDEERERKKLEKNRERYIKNMRGSFRRERDRQTSSSSRVSTEAIDASYIYS
ncbi:hypothetical protein TIFTF001_000512 [Ficus carica]|uniref:Uncharacterized protein n=1 Tax=Ficus carica TaxID=3494 RepID=A0AA87Z2E3_FICCA|nr:hypothetical protein TIFTF001_000512 [Ficus carica]